MIRVSLVALLVALAAACPNTAGPGAGMPAGSPDPGAGPAIDRPDSRGGLALGTWGGDNAAVRVSEEQIHVHIGCTFGDAPKPGRLAPDGRFEVEGRFNVDAYPVNRGIDHPARFAGRVSGNRLTITVTLTDNGRVLGPATVEYGREPLMKTCPVCGQQGALRGGAVPSPRFQRG